MKTHIIGIGTYANRIIEIIQQNIVDCQIQFWQIDKDAEGYLNGDFINLCMEACKCSNKIILFVALGGNTGSHATQLIVDELVVRKLLFTSVVILPHLMEGGINITRALQSVDVLVQKSSRVYLWENRNGGTKKESVHEGLMEFESTVIGLIKKAVEGQHTFPKDGYKLILDDYKVRCQKQIHVLYSLAKIHEEGNDTKQDFEKAFDYYLRAAEFGHVGALYNLGSLYENGEGVAQDYKKAVEYYTNAAGKGNSDAACCLARLYEEGIGVSKDNIQAFHWYMKAAQADRMPHAIYKIGCMYLEGRGTQKDCHEGMKYLRIAALTGYQLAREEMKKIRLESYTSKSNKATINQRLGLLVAESGLSSLYYTKKIGYPTKRFQNVLDGIEEVDISLLRAIRKAYPDVDLNWLVGE